MKILFVRTYCPNPIFYGSEMRGSRFIEYLRTKGEVDLLTLTEPTEMADTEYIKNTFRKFYFFDQKGNHSRLTSLEKLFYLLPWQITGHYAKDFQEKLNQILEENQYDLIFVFKLEPVFYFLQLPKKWHKRIVIDFDDILSDLYLNYYKEWFTAYKNSFSLKFYEHKALNLFKRIFVCSKDAVAKIPSLQRKHVGIIPNIFQINKENYFLPTDNKNKLLFIGSLDYFPNTEGLKWFFDFVWPPLKNQFPNLHMTVVGKAQKDSKHISSMLGNPKDVEIIVNAPSVLSYYKDSFVSIVPLLNGSGTRLKILESAAYGRPVLSTLKGMEGLDFENEKSIFIFKDAQSFIDGYKKLLDMSCYTETTKQALKIIQQKYSLEAFTESMDQNWSRIME